MGHIQEDFWKKVDKKQKFFAHRDLDGITFPNFVSQPATHKTVIRHIKRIAHSNFSLKAQRPESWVFFQSMWICHKIKGMFIESISFFILHSTFLICSHLFSFIKAKQTESNVFEINWQIWSASEFETIDDLWPLTR